MAGGAVAALWPRGRVLGPWGDREGRGRTARVPGDRGRFVTAGRRRGGRRRRSRRGRLDRAPPATAGGPRRRRRALRRPPRRGLRRLAALRRVPRPAPVDDP